MGFEDQSASPITSKLGGLELRISETCGNWIAELRVNSGRFADVLDSSNAFDRAYVVGRWRKDLINEDLYENMIVDAAVRWSMCQRNRPSGIGRKHGEVNEGEWDKKTSEPKPKSK